MRLLASSVAALCGGAPTAAPAGGGGEPGGGSSEAYEIDFEDASIGATLDTLTFSNGGTFAASSADPLVVAASPDATTKGLTVADSGSADTLFGQGLPEEYNLDIVVYEGGKSLNFSIQLGTQVDVDYRVSASAAVAQDVEGNPILQFGFQESGVSEPPDGYIGYVFTNLSTASLTTGRHTLTVQLRTDSVTWLVDGEAVAGVDGDSGDPVTDTTMPLIAPQFGSLIALTVNSNVGDPAEGYVDGAVAPFIDSITVTPVGG